MEKDIAKFQMADAAFERGASAFANGKYQETIDELTRCLSMEKSEEYQHLDADSYNMLGMLFSFSGYETTALDYYLMALESARKYENMNGIVSSLLNIGLLYQGCKEYQKAMPYYMKAKEAAEQDVRSQDILLMLYTNIQIAQLYCRMGQFVEARRMYAEIDNYNRIVMKDQLLLPKVILDLLLAKEEGASEKAYRMAEDVISQLQQDDNFVEQIDFYVDICELVAQCGYQNNSQMLYLLLAQKVEKTDFYRLKMRIAQIKIAYLKEYGEANEYEDACLSYAVLHEQYEKALHELQRENLKNIDDMQKLEEKKREIEKRNRCDFKTGLFSIKAFRHEVEKALSAYSKTTMSAMVFFDVDNFKLTNDRYGHVIGDEIIAVLAGQMKAFFADYGICGRFGGDQFLVFLNKVEDILSLEEKVEKFREEFEQCGFGKEKELHVTVSAGVAYTKGMKASYQSLLSCAEEALEKSKEYGKNKVSFYEIKRGIHGYV